MKGKFRAAERQFQSILAEVRAGRLADAAATAQAETLRVVDDRAQLWRIDPASGRWQRWDGQMWRDDHPARAGRLGRAIAWATLVLVAAGAVAAVVWFRGHPASGSGPPAAPADAAPVELRHLASPGGHFDVACPAGGDARERAADVGRLLDEAFDRYRSAGFRMPSGRVAVVLLPDATGAAASGDIVLSLGELEPVERAGQNAAQALFRAVQGRALDPRGREWWLEGAAEHAARTIAWRGRTPLPDFPRFWLEEPLTDPDRTHGRALAHFLDYLTRHRGLRFKDAWDAVAAQAHTPSSTLRAFMRHVEVTAGAPFVDVWRDFVVFALFDAASTVPEATVRSLVSARQPAHLDDQATVARHDFALPGGYTAQPWLVTGAGAVVIDTTEHLPDGVYLELRVLPGDRRAAGGAPLRQRLFDLTSTSQPIELAPGDALYVLALNASKAPAQVSVDARAVAAGRADIVGTWECTPAHGGGEQAVVVVESASGPRIRGTFHWDGRKPFECEWNAANNGWTCKLSLPGNPRWQGVMELQKRGEGRLQLVSPACVLYKRG